MNILIVDKKTEVRGSLKSALEALYDRVYLIDTASCMKEVAEKTVDISYDLVFFDQQLLLELAEEELAKIKRLQMTSDLCVMCNAYSVDFFKKIGRMKMSGYIEKNSTLDELKDLVDAVYEERNEKERLESTFSAKVQRCIDLDDFSNLMNMAGDFELYLFMVDSRDKKKEKEIYRKLYVQLEDEYLKNEQRQPLFSLFFGTEGELYLLSRGNRIIDKAVFLKRQFAQFEGIFITGCLSKLDGLNSLKEEMDFLLAMSPLRYLSPNFYIYSREDIGLDEESIKKRYFAEKFERVLFRWDIGDYEGINEEMNRIEEELEPYCLQEVFQNNLSIILDNKISESTSESFLARLKQIIDDDILKHLESGDIISRVQNYVRSHYMEDLSLGNLGEILDITPTYLSRVFREKTGEKYIDYITRIRMENASRFLLKGEYSIKKVSEMVGYYSEKHFARIFKKYFNVSPSRYGFDNIASGKVSKQTG